MNDLEKFKVKANYSIRKAVKKMDEAGRGFCVCVDENDTVVGVISDGDFRRGVLSGVSLDDSLEKIINRDFRFVNKIYSKSEVRNIFLEDVARHIPVLDEGNLLDIITEEKIFGFERHNAQAVKLDTPVVIMAGGKGKRLDPFTRILPKPLIPLGDEPVIKVIMDQFCKYGMNDFFISLNDKGRMIKAYFHDHEFNYRIKYLEEDKPLGTAGALKYLTGNIEVPFFVSNCDIIIYSNYEAICKFHQVGSYDITLVGSMQQFTIPYGVCEIDNSGTLKGIREKPKYDFLVNTGLYLLNPSLLDLIPPNTYFDMTDLIQTAQDNGLEVGVFPVSEKSWIDVGQWSQYKKALMDLDPEFNL